MATILTNLFTLHTISPTRPSSNVSFADNALSRSLYRLIVLTGAAEVMRTPFSDKAGAVRQTVKYTGLHQFYNNSSYGMVCSNCNTKPKRMLRCYEQLVFSRIIAGDWSSSSMDQASKNADIQRRYCVQCFRFGSYPMKPITYFSI